MQFPLESLLFPGLAILIATLFITFEVTRTVSFSIVAALIKAGIFVLYFGVLFDGTYTFSDDWDYLDRASDMYDQDLGITDIIDNVDALQGITGGDHYGYALYNVYAIKLFGFGYYAPVALNIILTIFIAWAGANLAAIEFGFTDTWRKVFFAFLLFHPDILAWSNIMNGKDTLILLLHLLLLYSVSLFLRRHVVTGVTLAIIVCYMLSALRFYVPLLFGAAFATSMILLSTRNYSNVLKFVVGGFVLLSLYLTDHFDYKFHIESLNDSFVNPFYGLIHFMFTPIPFNTQPEYAFLDIPALIHWLLMPFVILGFMTIVKQPSEYELFFILYVLVFLALYSVYGELQEPRHRVQIDYAWAVLQFMGIKPFLTRAFSLQVEAAEKFARHRAESH